MKKILLTSIALFAFGFANAQDEASFGVKGGLDLVSYKYTVSDGLGGTVSGTESLTGFFIGGFAEFGIADKFMLQPGLNYHTASKSLAGETLKANFLSIPVLVKYEIAESFNLMAGPSLFYSLESDDEDKTRFNFDLGASYDFTENFFVEPRYSAGLTGDIKIGHILIGVGYKF
jgi:opacity protein-like surface antigen